LKDNIKNVLPVIPCPHNNGDWRTVRLCLHLPQCEESGRVCSLCKPGWLKVRNCTVIMSEDMLTHRQDATLSYKAATGIF